MGSACSKGLTALDPADDASSAGAPGRRTAAPAKAPTGNPGNTAIARRTSERRGLRHGLAHAGRHVWDHYTVEREIGHGMTGKVYLVRSKVSGDTFALKSMDLKRLDVTSRELLEDLKAEVELLRGLDHPTVIKLFEYFVEPPVGDPVQSLYLVLEFCSGGELFDRLHAQPSSRFTEHEAAYLTNQMVAAVAYIHAQGIAHRDLKLENFIFTDASPTMSSCLKLIDFGLSARYSGTGVRRMTTLCAYAPPPPRPLPPPFSPPIPAGGTPYYLAPEVLNQSEGAGGYTTAIDEWSLGVIAYMLLSGTPPFKGRRDREVLQAVRRGKYTLSGPRWESISEEAKDFIRHLLVYNPSKRTRSEQALKHPWLVGARMRGSGGVSRRLDEDIVTNLREFRTLTAFKRAALEAIAFSMSNASLSRVRDAFGRLDVEGSGIVGLAEFVQVMRDTGLSREEATAIFASIAPAGSPTLSYSEFLAATLNKGDLGSSAIRAAFSRLDVDSSGFITRDNLRAVMGDDWSPAVEDAFFREADKDGDGVVSADEFRTALSRAFGLPVTIPPPAALPLLLDAPTAHAMPTAEEHAGPRLGPSASAPLPRAASPPLGPHARTTSTTGSPRADAPHLGSFKPTAGSSREERQTSHLLLSDG
jgi:calcium-dependent protein kinase